MSTTTILYRDISVGAAEDASVSATGSMDESDVSSLIDGITSTPIATLEHNNWVLDGTFDFLDNSEIAFWSAEVSDDDGEFSTSPVIKILFDSQYNSTGLTLTFDPATGLYCSKINIKWYQGEMKKESADFYPDSTKYVCNQTAKSFDRIEITLLQTNIPNRRAKLSHILLGIERTFDMTEIRTATIKNDLSLISLEIPVSTFNWRLDSHDDVDYMFQLKQPVEVRNDGNLLGVYYIDESTRQSSSIYDLSCYDAFGILDEIPFPGAVYVNKSAQQLVYDIIDGSFDVSFNVDDVNLTGAILDTTRRGALQQVLFAWGVCAATDASSGIRIFYPGTIAQAIGANRTYTGATARTTSVVTEVRVTSHAYTQNDDGDVTINGIKYLDTKTVHSVQNPDVTVNDKQNIVEITDATLISSSIGQSCAQRVYDYYARRATNSAKIVWDGEKLGDRVTVPNSWGASNTGNVETMSITLSNVVAASCEVIGE